MRFDERFLHVSDWQKRQNGSLQRLETMQETLRVQVETELRAMENRLQKEFRDLRQELQSTSASNRNLFIGILCSLVTSCLLLVINLATQFA